MFATMLVYYFYYSASRSRDETISPSIFILLSFTILWWQVFDFTSFRSCFATVIFNCGRFLFFFIGFVFIFSVFEFLFRFLLFKILFSFLFFGGFLLLLKLFPSYPPLSFQAAPFVFFAFLSVLLSLAFPCRLF